MAEFEFKWITLNTNFINHPLQNAFHCSCIEDTAVKWKNIRFNHNKIRKINKYRDLQKRDLWKWGNTHSTQEKSQNVEDLLPLTLCQMNPLIMWWKVWLMVDAAADWPCCASSCVQAKWPGDSELLHGPVAVWTPALGGQAAGSQLRARL